MTMSPFKIILLSIFSYNFLWIVIFSFSSVSFLCFLPKMFKRRKKKKTDCIKSRIISIATAVMHMVEEPSPFFELDLIKRS